MILVTGATGFVGGHLVDRLISLRQPVRVLVRRSRVFENSPVDVCHADLAAGEAPGSALDGVDTVIHLAGATKVLKSSGYWAGNVAAAENLARAVAATGRAIRFVHASSLAAVGPAPDNEPLTEDAEARPVSEYGRTKLEGERRVRRILPGAVIVRPPVVYGPRDTGVFPVLKSIERGLVLRIAGGERRFSAICVSDLVEGIAAAASAPRVEGRCYFLAHPAVVSFSELIAVAAEAMKRSPRIVTIPEPLAYTAGYGAELWARLVRRPGIVSRDKVSEMVHSRWICATARAKEELGFEARTGLREGVAAAVSWYREAGWLR